MTTCQTVTISRVPARQITVGDRVIRRTYLREVLAVYPSDETVALTIDRGFGETVTETHDLDALIEVVR